MTDSTLTAALALVLVGLVAGAPARAELSPFRLDGSAAPSRYRIALDLDLADRAFRGRETIELELRRPARSIRLHAVGLEIGSARARVGERTLPLEASFDREHEILELRAGEELPAGPLALELEFRGALGEDLRGLYLSHEGERAVVATQMQATYARRAFPCFDEPAFKAVFELEVTLDERLTAVSNGAVASEAAAGPGRKRVVFAPSPRMSTYLLALAASEFEIVAERAAGGVPVRVLAPPGRGAEARWALEVARRVLEHFDGWYGIPYPFGKLDLVAIPSYEWGGMENTAAIFFRQSALLFDPATGSPDKRRGVAALVAHEIGHQWFGDLVTTEWWDDVWLNEGFATWITDKPLAAMRADWDRPVQAVAEGQWVIGLDALPTTRPIRGRADSPGEIKELFDGVAYTKGAAVLRMVEAWIGEEPFRRGVNAYLERHAWGSARSEDLGRALAASSGRAVDEVLATFVEQAGVPAVSFAVTAAGGGTRVELSQERFFVAAGTPRSGERWRIPVCFRWADVAGVARERCELLTGASASLELPGEVAWLVGNAGGRGYYRVAYSSAQLEALARVAATLPATERLALLHDAWAMVETGRAGVDLFLGLVERLDGERDRSVLGRLLGAVAEVRRTLAGEAERPAFDAWTRARLAPLAAELGAEPRADDDDDTRSLRAAVFAALAVAGDADAIGLARARVERALAEPGAVDPALAAAAFEVAPRSGDAALFARLERALLAGATGDTLARLLVALPRFERPELVERALDLAEAGRVPIDEYPAYFAALLENPAARARAWEYLKADWAELAPRVISFGGRGAVPALGSICSAELERDVRAFFASHPAPGAERALAQALERIGLCLDFRAAQAERFRAWLAGRPGGALP